MLILIGFISCKERFVKPFIVISKEKSTIKTNAYLYKYTDSVGNQENFYDTFEYHIGDTLK